MADFRGELSSYRPEMKKAPVAMPSGPDVQGGASMPPAEAGLVPEPRNKGYRAFSENLSPDAMKRRISGQSAQMAREQR